MSLIDTKCQIAERERLFLQEWAVSSFNDKRIFPPVGEKSSYLPCNKSGARLYGWENMMDLNIQLKDICQNLPQCDTLAKTCAVAAYKFQSNNVISADKKDIVASDNSQAVPDFIYVF